MFAKLFSSSSTSAHKDAETLENDVHTRAREYDYVRFSFADMNGTSRGKVITGRSANKFLSEGVGVWSGSFCYGANGDIPLKTIKKVVDLGNPSMLLVPDMHTLHAVPWASTPETRIAEILCHGMWLHDKTPVEGPRHIAMKQLDTLHGMGYELQSAFETEYKLFLKDSGDPVIRGLDYCVQSNFARCQDFMVRLDRGLSMAGVNVEMMHSEYSDGQFEVAVEPKIGPDSADDIFIVKHAIKDMAMMYGLRASFMARLDAAGAGSGQHFNFSVFNIEQQKNAFFDEKGELGLSDFARHWIGGLVKHAGALCALCCPTVNCYRRLHRPLAPDTNFWAIQNRDAMIRVKNDGPKGTYMENRMPSGLCNPYIVLAATVAAGIDGIKSNLPCPPANNPEAEELPRSLGEALKCLEEDKVIVQALGQEFVDWFVGLKREIDMSNLKDSDPNNNDEKAIKAEVAFYDRLV